MPSYLLGPDGLPLLWPDGTPILLPDSSGGSGGGTSAPGAAPQFTRPTASGIRYRALDANGDYTFGLGAGNFLVNSPAAVAQAVQTRLKLWEGEWFLDTSEGMPWLTKVLGTGTRGTYDQAIRERILGTQGVIEIAGYYSTVIDRALGVVATISTQYGSTSLAQVLQ